MHTHSGMSEASDMKPVLDTAFLDGTTWGCPGEQVVHRETHAAHVFLCGDRAYKIKKAVRLPYLDFSSLEKRQAIIARELEINRVFAPEIYLSTTAVLGEPVLVLRRFDEDFLLATLAARETISAELAAGLAQMMAAAHHRAEKRSTKGATIVAGLGQQLSAAFAASPDIFPPAEAQAFTTRFAQVLGKKEVLLDKRSAQGLVRRCHGDAHCGNIVVHEGRPLLFDAIEFSEGIATIDVFYDLAFLLMDLSRRHQPFAANMILNGYLDLSRRDEDLSGLALLSLFMSIRAGVRALVSADRVHEMDAPADIERKRCEAREYFALCMGYLRDEKPRLVCVGGLSGSGKSTLAMHLAPLVLPRPGAIVIRSDVERKRLAGLDPQAHLPQSAYAAGSSQLVYQTMLDRARVALNAGATVILDAVFAREEERASAQQLAQSLGVVFCGFWLEVDTEEMKRRVAARQGDASDATPQVIDKQLQYDVGALTWQRLSTATPFAEALASAVTHLEQSR